jgi:hypothetical protein
MGVLDALEQGLAGVPWRGVRGQGRPSPSLAWMPLFGGPDRGSQRARSLKDIRGWQEWAQKSACPGVRGKGIASLTFSMPVT